MLRFSQLMTLVSIPANPVPDDVVTGTLKTRDGVSLRFARWAPPPGRKGTVCLFQGRSEFIEKYFETVRDLRTRGFAVATLDWRGQGMSDRALRNRRKGYVRSFSQYQIGRASGLSAAGLCACAFDGRDDSPTRGPSRASLVRSHGAAGADDCAARHAPVHRQPHVGPRHAHDGARLALCSGRRRGCDDAASVHRQPAHLRSRALRA
jgi:alpha-beta hydrolase superfamily lysophospholipase